MVDARRQDQQVVLLEEDAHPPVALVPHVEVAAAAADVADLLVLVQVLVEEGLDLVLVGVAHVGGRHGDLVAVAVAALRGEAVDVGRRGQVAVDDAEPGQGVGRDGGAAVVREALVALYLNGLATTFKREGF